MVTVDVPANLSANESHVLLRAAEKDMGVAMLAHHIARESLRAGRVVELLQNYPVPDLVVKALVPETRRRSPAIRALLDWMIDACQPIPPWDR